VDKDEILPVMDPDPASGFGLDSPWRRSALSECLCSKCDYADIHNGWLYKQVKFLSVGGLGV